MPARPFLCRDVDLHKRYKFIVFASILLSSIFNFISDFDFLFKDLMICKRFPVFIDSAILCLLALYCTHEY